MTGTEKQIKWAQDIKAEFIKNFKYRSPLTEKKTELLLDKLFSAFTDATWWIENRVMLNTDIVNYDNIEQLSSALNSVFAQAVEINPELAKHKK